MDITIIPRSSPNLESTSRSLDYLHLYSHLSSLCLLSHCSPHDSLQYISYQPLFINHLIGTTAPLVLIPAATKSDMSSVSSYSKKGRSWDVTEPPRASRARRGRSSFGSDTSVAKNGRGLVNSLEEKCPDELWEDDDQIDGALRVKDRGSEGSEGSEASWDDVKKKSTLQRETTMASTNNKKPSPRQIYIHTSNYTQTSKSPTSIPPKSLTNPLKSNRTTMILNSPSTPPNTKTLFLIYSPRIRRLLFEANVSTSFPGSHSETMKSTRQGIGRHVIR